MALRDYGSGVSTVITSGIGTGDTSVVIADATGWPTGSGGNFFATIDGGTIGEERVLCSTRSGTTVNFTTRGADGTSASTHNSNASIWPSSSKTDLQEANTHVNSSAGVHGLSGTVVGTSDAQNLTNKTITNATVTGATITGGSINVPTIQQGGVTLADLSSTQTFANKTLTSPTINSATLTGTLTGATVNATTLQQGGVQAVTTTGAQTLTNKTLTSPSMTNPSMSGNLTGLTLIDATTVTQAGIGIITTSSSSTLTNKTMSGASNTFTAIPESAVSGLTSDLAPLTASQGVWTSYSPAITGYTTVTTTLGGCRYITDGKTVHCHGQFTIASITTLGSATINVALPVTASANLPAQHAVGVVQYRTNAGAFYMGLASFGVSDTTFTILIPTVSTASNLGRMTGASPAGQVVNDIISWAFTYESA